MKKDLKVAFYVYPDAFQAPGGGEVQLLKTKEFLEKMGIQVSLFNTWSDHLEDFDILHTFGSVKECLRMIEIAKMKRIKTVLSTICWFSWKSAWGIYPNISKRSENLMRQFAKSAFPAVPSMRKSMMEISDLLFPNSEAEAQQLTRYFGIPKDKIFVVPNGVDRGFNEATPDRFYETYGIRNFVLSVGRIEPRKNQLQMIRAMKGTDIPFVIIGECVPQYRDYGARCRHEADGNVHFLGAIDHDSELLASAYAACNTFLLASWLETPGLAALEAALAGAKVVITNEGATKEYFGDHAEYAAPDNLDQIREVTLKTYKKSSDNRLPEHILNHYLWEHTAKKTLEGYQLL